MPKDIAAVVPYTLEHAGAESLAYIGWSQANTAMLVAGLIPEIAAQIKPKVHLWAALSAVSYMKHSDSELLTVSSRLRIGAILEKAYPYGFLNGPTALDGFDELICKATLGAVCKVTVDVFCGKSKLDNATAIEAIAAHFPAGTSVKAMTHYPSIQLSA